MTEYIACPREHFLQRVLGWHKIGTSLHLDFGTAFHEALATLYLSLKVEGRYTDKGIVVAQAVFEQEYKKLFGGDCILGVYNDPNMGAKNLANGLHAIEEYAKRYNTDHFFDVRHIETVGTVPISGDAKLFFRLDTVLQGADKKFFIMEHKTASQDSSSQQAHWPLAFQIGTYNHALFLMFGEEANGVEVDIVILRQKGNEFRRVPCWIQADRMQDWLEQANHYSMLLRQDLDIFQGWASTDASRTDTTMPCFVKRTTSCLRYGECPFMNFCLSHHNPLQGTGGTPPPGYEVSFWDPREMEKKEGTTVVNL
jgi:hypothetical protein